MLVSGYLLEKVTDERINNEVLKRKLENSNSKIQNLTQEVSKHQETENQLKTTIIGYEETLRSRDLYEDLIIDVAKIRCENNLKNLDDDVFFLMLGECRKYDIPLDIYFRLIDMESGFKFVENKQSGAYGYMQVMPTTFDYIAKQMGIVGPNDKINNILVGSYLLKKNYDSWKSRGFSDTKSWRLALAEYNAGEGKLQVKHDGKLVGWREPSYTQFYINYIMKHHPV
jgi:hypothetical protein